MKRLSMLAVLAVSLPALAVLKFEKADSIFDKRGEDRNNAQIAAGMFGTLAKSEADVLVKAQAKVRESRAFYYLGRTTEKKSEKKALYTKGYKAANEAVALLSAKPGVAKKDSYKTDLAHAHYYYAANLGKWGKANGKLSSLGKWPELRSNLDMIDGLGPEAQALENYGSMRVRGRALHELPFGDKNEALRLIKHSFENSMPEGFDMSASTTTTIYYLDILAKTNTDVDTFCEVYEMMLDLSEMDDEELKEELTDLNPNLVPEGMIEVRQFGNGEGFVEDVQKYADRKCDL
jgi:hypothetical protein